jgi:hypothetical protein
LVGEYPLRWCTNRRVITLLLRWFITAAATGAIVATIADAIEIGAGRNTMMRVIDAAVIDAEIQPPGSRRRNMSVQSRHSLTASCPCGYGGA